MSTKRKSGVQHVAKQTSLVTLFVQVTSMTKTKRNHKLHWAAPPSGQPSLGTVVVCADTALSAHQKKKNYKKNVPEGRP